MSHRATKDYRIHVAVLVAILLIVAAISIFIHSGNIVNRSPNTALTSWGSKRAAGWHEGGVLKKLMKKIGCLSFRTAGAA